MTRIAICAPATPITHTVADAVTALAAREFPSLVLAFHDQCFAENGHFAGEDRVRLAAFLECAHDPGSAAVWFAKGGYGSNRIAGEAVVQLSGVAHDKAYLGYSDCGFLLAGLYRHGIGKPTHGPMPTDIRRKGGDQAVLRALGWLSGSDEGLEPSLSGAPTVAFNLMTLSSILGTELEPELSGHVVILEEVAEHLYAVDRLLFHVTAGLADRNVAGLRLGRVSDVPENDRPFGSEPCDMARYWCERHGIAFLGAAEIGHSPDNRIVPFGVAGECARS